MKSRVWIGLFAVAIWGWALPVQNVPVPGGIAVVGLGEFGPQPPEAFLGERRLRVDRLPSGEWAAVAGIPLSAKKGEALAVTHTDTSGARVHTVFAVEHRDYPEQRLRVSEDRYVHPDPQELKRIGSESIRMRAQLESYTPKRLADFELLRPAPGRISSAFGLRRYFNDEPRNPHSGVDLAAPRHTPVKAAQAGRVAMADDFFFCGKFVLIDHGQGLQTLYCHLETTTVKKGAVVKKGAQIGTVGSSGRATGPHLHWGVSLNGVWVDPAFLQPQPASSGNKTKPAGPRPATAAR